MRSAADFEKPNNRVLRLRSCPWARFRHRSLRRWVGPPGDGCGRRGIRRAVAPQLPSPWHGRWCRQHVAGWWNEERGPAKWAFAGRATLVERVVVHRWSCEPSGS